MNSGDVVYVQYHADPGVFHTRLLASCLGGDEWMIITPDHDMYSEVYNHANPDIARFYHAADRRLPRQVPAGQVYAFQPMDARQYGDLLRGGRREADAELRRRGLPAVGGAQAPAVGGQGPADNAGVAADPDGGGPAMVWVLAEMLEGRKIGERVAPPAGLLHMGDWGIMNVANAQGVTRPCLIHQLTEEEVPRFCEERIRLARISEAAEGDDLVAADDVRTMEIRYGPNGERLRSFRESVAEMHEVDFNDYPLEPRTALAYVKAVAGVAESCYAQHLAWVAQSRIPEGDRAIHESEVLSRVVDTAITYDGLNIANLASFELVIRRKQLLAEAHAYNPSAPSYEGADHFMGTTYRPGGAIVVPSLTEFVSKKMGEEAQILKERRKLAEAKGRGRGRGAPKTPPEGGKGAPNK